MIKYRGYLFEAYNRPIKYVGPGLYKERVLAKEGSKVKMLSYGNREYQDYTQHHDKKRRKNFRARMRCDPVKNMSKLSKRYWACESLW
jgi:hypothetical protein